MLARISRLPTTNLFLIMKTHKQYLLFLPFLVFAALLSGQSPRTGDYWWRLHFGQKTLRGNLQKTNFSSFSSQQKWIDHSWGYGALIAGIDNLGGFKAVKAFHSLLFFLLLLVVFSGFSGFHVLAGFLGVLLIYGHYALRPYLFGDLFLLGMVLAIIKLKSGGISFKKITGWKPVLAVYVYFTLWSNFHGSVMAGFLLGAFLLFPFSRIFPRMATGFGQNSDKPPQTELSWQGWFFTCMAAVAGIFTNPWFHRLPFFLLKYIFGFYRFLPRIDEWQSPTQWMLGLIVVYLIYLFYRGLKNNIPKYYFLVLIILFGFGAASGRNLPVLVIVGNLLTAKNPVSFLVYLKNSWNVKIRIPVIFILLLIVFVPLFSIFQKSRYNFEFRKSVYPRKLFVQSRRHLEVAQVKRVFVPHRWGGALLYHFDGRYLNFIDSRNDCFSREVWDDYFTIIYNRPGWWRIWQKYKPEAVFLPGETNLPDKLQAKNWQIKVKNHQGVLLLKPVKK
ncbi:MAG: hypothetical protein ACQES9_03910 [Myxococcota bacterium]